MLSTSDTIHRVGTIYLPFIFLYNPSFVYLYLSTSVLSGTFTFFLGKPVFSVNSNRDGVRVKNEDEGDDEERGRFEYDINRSKVHCSGILLGSSIRDLLFIIPDTLGSDGNDPREPGIVKTRVPDWRWTI